MKLSAAAVLKALCMKAQILCYSYAVGLEIEIFILRGHNNTTPLLARFMLFDHMSMLHIYFSVSDGLIKWFNSPKEAT